MDVKELFDKLNDLQKMLLQTNEFEEEVLFQEKMEDLLATLPEREREVLKMRFGLGGYQLTLEEVELNFDVMRKRLPHIEAKVLRKLCLSKRRKLCYSKRNRKIKAHLNN